MAKQLNVIPDDEDHRQLLKTKSPAVMAGLHHDAYGEIEEKKQALHL